MWSMDPLAWVLFNGKHIYVLIDALSDIFGIQTFFKINRFKIGFGLTAKQQDPGFITI